MNKMKKYRKNESGVILLFSIILISIILGIGLALSSIFIGKLRASIDAKSSVGAYYAADSGIEWKLYDTRVAAEPFSANLSIGSEFEIEEGDGYIRSLGTYRGVSRAIEVIDYEVPPESPTPTPRIEVTCSEYTLNASQTSLTATEITYRVVASTPGRLETGERLNLNTSGNYDFDKVFTRGAASRTESITFVPDEDGDSCSRTLGNLVVPAIVITPPPPPPCRNTVVGWDLVDEWTSAVYLGDIGMGIGEDPLNCCTCRYRIFEDYDPRYQCIVDGVDVSKRGGCTRWDPGDVCVIMNQRDSRVCDSYNLTEDDLGMCKRESDHCR